MVNPKIITFINEQNIRLEYPYNIGSLNEMDGGFIRYNRLVHNLTINWDKVDSGSFCNKIYGLYGRFYKLNKMDVD